MRIKRAAAVLGTLTISSGLVAAFGPAPLRANAAIPFGVVVEDAGTYVEGDVGSFPMSFAISRTGPIETCRITVSTTNGTASGGADYQAFSQVITIPEGDQFDPPVIVDVTLTPDDIFEPDADAGQPDYESLYLNATPYTGALADPPPCFVTDGQGIGWIEDDEQPGPLYVAMSPDFRECESAWHATHPAHATWSNGEVNTSFKLNRNLNDGEELTLDLVSANGTAVAGPDYGGLSVSYTITGPTFFTVDDNGTPADTSDDIVLFEASIPIVDEFTPELDEYFDVVMQNVTYTGPEQHFLVDTKQIIIIRNDDIVGNEISVNDPSHVEGDPGDDNYVTFTISSKYPAICDGIKIWWATQDTIPQDAKDSIDYVGGAGWAIIPPGGTSVDVDIPIIEDLLIENDEAFELTVYEPAGVVGDLVGRGTIIDDDFPFVDVSPASVVEGTGAGTTTLQFLVQLSGTTDSPTYVPHRPIRVFYSTSNGPAPAAVAPGDYTAAGAGAYIDIAPGDASGYIYVNVVRDSLPENNEFMTVTLTSAVNAIIDVNDTEDFPDGNDESAVGTIWNDDDWVVNGIDVSTLEGTPLDPNHAVVVTLQLNAPAPLQGFSVDWDLDPGTAADPLDYIDASGTANFASGFTTSAVNPVIVTDDLVEDDETFVVDLNNPQVIVSPGGCVGGCFRLILGTDATVTIVNDDVELPPTGNNVPPLTITGLGLLGAGLAMLFAQRRRLATR